MHGMMRPMKCARTLGWALVMVAAFLTEAAPAGTHRDLGDMAVGGDGTGSATPGLGLLVTTGQLIPPEQFGGSSAGGPLFIQTDGSNGTAALPFVDGVFLPHGTTQIDSTGRTFAFPGTSSRRYDALRHGYALYEGDPPGLKPIRLNDWPGVDRPGLGLHANSGITYDLAAIRAAGIPVMGVDGVAGLNFDSYQGAVEVWVLVDGQQRFRQAFLSGGDFGRFSLPLTSTDQYLTLVATDYNGSPAGDHAVIAEPVLLVPEPTGLACLAVVAVLRARRR